MIYYIIVHVICGVFAAGILLAYVQKEFSATARYSLRFDRIFCWTSGLMGGLATLVMALLCTGLAQHGLRWK